MKLLRLLIFVLSAFFCAVSAAGAERPVVWNMDRLERVRETLPGNRLCRRALSDLRRRCDSLLPVPNPHVMMKRAVPASGDRHDYMSLSRYYWPDPGSADGFPYVRRDGETNPDVDLYDRNRITELADNVCALTVGFYLTDDLRYGAKAGEMIRTWFLDEVTSMNPGLDYSQMIPGKNGGKGRPSGIIDMYRMIDVLDAVIVLRDKEVLSDGEMERLRSWFSQLVDWMLTAPNALKIAEGRNNLGVAYDVQLIRYAMFSGRTDLARRTLAQFPERRLAVQIEPDGRMPQELKRTKAMSYSIYNIVHMLDACAMARALGEDLYEAEGRAVERALRFLVPFLKDPDSFPYKQINERRLALDDIARQLLRADAYAGNKEFRRLYDRYGAEPEDPIFILFHLIN